MTVMTVSFIWQKWNMPGVSSIRDTEEQIIDSTMTKDERLKKLVRRYFTPDDYFLLRNRMIGSGAIGGKACRDAPRAKNL